MAGVATLADDEAKAGFAKSANIVLVLALVVAALRLYVLLTSAHRGIDFTDEGSYLVWIANPWIYGQSASQFGFMYHPVFAWLGGDVASLRQFNILLTSLMAWVLTLVFFRATLGKDWPAGYWRSAPMLAVAAVLATTYPNLLNMWLPTPSYNSLALQAIFLSAIGLLLVERRMSPIGVLGALLLGGGGWLAFMAKPTTAAAIAVVALLFLAGAGKLRFWSVLLSAIVAFGLLAASAVMIDGSVSGFVGRLDEAMQMNRMMGVEQPVWRLLRLDGFSFSGHDTLLFFVLLLAVVYGTGTGPAVVEDPGWRSRSMLLLLALTVVSLLVVFNALALLSSKGRFQGALALAPAAGATVAAALMWRTRWEGKFSRRHLSIAACLAALPHAYAFGTGNNYWQTGQTASLFWILGGMSILVAAVPANRTWRVFLPVAVASQLLSVGGLQLAMDLPYRQPEPLGQARWSVPIGAGSAQLQLTSGYANYVERLRKLAKDGGFEPGMPVIDLTGQSPGSLFAIGARSTGQAWLLGGYPGSDRLARYVLAGVSCDEIARAWILTEPSGPRGLSPDVLATVGIDIRKDYARVGEVRSPDGFGSYRNGSDQILLRPARGPAQATAACVATKKVSR